MIYKTFYGNHIDISKIVSISDAYFEDGSGGNFVGFAINFQLMNKPLLYKRKLTIEENGGWNDSLYILNVALTDGRVIEYGQHEIEDKEIQAVANLQKQVDEIIKVWEDFKETSQSSIEARLGLIEERIKSKGYFR